MPLSTGEIGGLDASVELVAFQIMERRMRRRLFENSPSGSHGQKGSQKGEAETLQGLSYGETLYRDHP
jgi:hypothetical protein